MMFETYDRVSDPDILNMVFECYKMNEGGRENILSFPRRLELARRLSRKQDTYLEKTWRRGL